jgi:hypothetical protein
MAATTRPALLQQGLSPQECEPLQAAIESEADRTIFSPQIAQAIFKVMASQVRPGLTKSEFNRGLQRSEALIRRQPAYSIRARDFASHTQAGCMAAIYS